MKILTSDLYKSNVKLNQTVVSRNSHSIVKLNICPCPNSLEFEISDGTFFSLSLNQKITVIIKGVKTRVKAKELINKKFKLMTSVLILPKKTEPFSSWVFGVWLGSDIQNIPFNCDKKYNLVLKNELSKNNWFYNNGIKSINKNNNFYQHIYSYLLDRDNIPDIFLYNSIESRKKLICGLEIGLNLSKKNKFKFKVLDNFLRSQILFLYRSCGIRCKQKNEYIFVNKNKPPFFSAKCTKSKDFSYLITSEKSFLTSDLWLI